MSSAGGYREHGERVNQLLCFPWILQIFVSISDSRVFILLEQVRQSFHLAATYGDQCMVLLNHTKAVNPPHSQHHCCRGWLSLPSHKTSMPVFFWIWCFFCCSFSITAFSSYLLLAQKLCWCYLPHQRPMPLLPAIWVFLPSPPTQPSSVGLRPAQGLGSYCC